MLGNTEQSYGLVSRLLHWAMALVIIGMLSTGFLLERIEFGPTKLQIIGLHKSFGVVILTLVVFRIAWHVLGKYPKSLPTHKVVEKFLAKAAHILLYVCMICMPLSGWLMSSSAGYPVSFFGLFDLPNLVEKNREFAGLMGQVHGAFAWGLVAVLGLHVLGGLKHHFVDKDSTLARMVRDGMSYKEGIVLSVLALILLAIPLVIALGMEEMH